MNEHSVASRNLGIPRRGRSPRSDERGRSVLSAVVALLCIVGTEVSTGSALAQASNRPSARSGPETFDCVIRPSMEVALSASAAGVVAQVRVDRGDLVRAGDVIARMKSDVEQASVNLARRQTEGTTKIDAAKARVAFLTLKYERSRTLNTRNVVSDGALDETRTELALAEQDLLEAEFNRGVAQLELERATALLQQKTIVSPVDGVIVERSLSPGEFLSEEKRIVKIAAIDPLFVEAFVPVSLHGKVEVGGKATVIPEDPIGGRYEALVDVVDRVYDAASGTFGLRLKLSNPKLAIPAGIRCSLAFDMREAKGTPSSTVGTAFR